MVANIQHHIAAAGRPSLPPGPDAQLRRRIAEDVVHLVAIRLLVANAHILPEEQVPAQGSEVAEVSCRRSDRWAPESPDPRRSLPTRRNPLAAVQLNQAAYDIAGDGVGIHVQIAGDLADAQRECIRPSLSGQHRPNHLLNVRLRRVQFTLLPVEKPLLSLHQGTGAVDAAGGSFDIASRVGQGDPDGVPGFVLALHPVVGVVGADDERAAGRDGGRLPGQG